MNEKFLKLDPAKQEKWLQVICQEFAEQNYEDASTNRIVERAGISKGTLFNYFGNKESLYHDLLRYVLDHFDEYVVLNFETNDFIERCYVVAQKKMSIYQEMPHVLEFLAMLHVNDFPNVPPELKERMLTMTGETMRQLYDGVDVTLFREDVPATELMRMIGLIFDGHTVEMTARLKSTPLTSHNFEQWMDEFDEMLKHMKQIFYKEELN